MARRRKRDAGGSLDSLLDTMTNVVGILVILLVVTQLGVKEAVNRIGESESVQPEVIAKVEKQADEATMQRFLLEKQWEQLQNRDPQAARKELQQALADGHQTLAEIKQENKLTAEVVARKLADAEKLQKEQLEELARLEQQQRDLENQTAEMRARLASAPKPTGLPAKIVHLPNPRPAPKKAKPITFLCREGKIMQLNVAGAQDRATKWTAAYVKRRNLDRDPKKGIDCDTLFRAFNRESFDDRNFVLKLVNVNRYPYIVFNRKKTAGETLEQLNSRSSRYRAFLERLNKQQYYVRYLVWSDSFEVYLKARSMAVEYGIAAGWQPMSGDSEYRLRMSGPLRCGPPPPPSPKPANPPPKPKDPPREPPSDTID